MTNKAKGAFLCAKYTRVMCFSVYFLFSFSLSLTLTQIEAIVSTLCVTRCVQIGISE